MEGDSLTDAKRVETTYECPKCGSDRLTTPTYRQRRCGGCGFRGREAKFAADTAECPDCEEPAIRTHTDGVRDGYMCRNCYTGFSE